MTDDENQPVVESLDERRSSFIRSSDRRIWVLTGIAALAILALGLSISVGLKSLADKRSGDKADQAQQRQESADVACVREWAIAFADRADRLNDLSEARNDALDAALLAAIARKPQAEVQRLAVKYRAVVLARRKVLAANPLPPSPEFECGTPSGGSSPARVPQSTRTATATARATVTRPAPPAPPATRTVGGRVVVTRPAATRTAARTVSRTVFPPPVPPPVVLPTRCNVTLPPVPIALPTGIRLC